MKNFDADRNDGLTVAERTFTIRGEKFVAKVAVKPEVLAKWDEMPPDAKVIDYTATFDSLVVAMIEPHDDALARWQRVREQEDDPVSFEELGDVVRWLVEATSGRPTGLPSGSSDGPGGRDGTSSTEGSSSPEVEAAPV